MIDPAQIELIASVEHGDPHTILGPHAEDGGTVVRAFRPDALAVTVVADDGERVLAERIHPKGVFAARFDKKHKFPYRLEVHYAKETFHLRDPYFYPPSVGELDLHLVHEGKHARPYEVLGAHVRVLEGQQGTSFAVWAPHAKRVSVTGDFDSWDGRLHAMRRLGNGIWEIFIPEIGDGALYKYEIKTHEGALVLKADPYGQAMELRPHNASKVVTRRYQFKDDQWMASRARQRLSEGPLSIYEVHLGSWRKHLAPQGERGVGARDPASRFYTYAELAKDLVDYVADLGFTHIELLPITEHPYDGSWGYQTTGYFAPTSRFGAPDDLRAFVDACHAKNIGVLLDWTPAHFPKDAFSLGRFDGTALYEHLDPRQGEHKHWDTYIFNYARPEVRNFLVSSALYWFDEFHIDGIRVDAVASMLYLDYSANGPGDWVPNRYGGRENLEAVAFLRELNDRIHTGFPGAITCAEESTTWPGVTRPTYVGGLGFDFKWNMGWMHDTLDYMKLDPIYRANHHTKITFGIWYAWSERFLLPFSHDEVVHLKKSMLSKMPGDRWQMLASLRALYGYMFAHPGKKLLFMGAELGQWGEWNHDAELEWGALGEADRRGVFEVLKNILALYKQHPALFELDDQSTGFLWIDANDSAQSVASFVRFAKCALNFDPNSKVDRPCEHVVFAGNFTPVPRVGYRLGVPRKCAYLEVLNTDAREFGGSGMGNMGKVHIEEVPCHGFAQSIVATLPPLSAVWFVPEVQPSEG